MYFLPLAPLVGVITAKLIFWCWWKTPTLASKMIFYRIRCIFYPFALVCRDTDPTYTKRPMSAQTTGKKHVRQTDIRHDLTNTIRSVETQIMVKRTIKLSISKKYACWGLEIIEKFWGWFNKFCLSKDKQNLLNHPIISGIYVKIFHRSVTVYQLNALNFVTPKRIAISGLIRLCSLTIAHKTSKEKKHWNNKNQL